jgi:hypothetical protein
MTSDTHVVAGAAGGKGQGGVPGMNDGIDGKSASTMSAP